jgi:hypothetical protein
MGDLSIPIPTNTIIDATRILDTYSESGDVGAYSTYFGLVLDYGIGITVLTAGDNPMDYLTSVRQIRFSNILEFLY